MGPAFSGDPGTVAEERLDLLAGLCAESAEQDGAEAIILAGGPLAGLAPLLQPRVAVPLIDGTQAAVRLAEALAGLVPRGTRLHRPRGLTGFAPEVAGLYAAR
jgi:Asp/Glu/hydantoin racemase